MAQARTPLTKDQIEAFTAGDCWRLAGELMGLGVGEVVFLSNENSDAPLEFFPWEHVVVRLPSGLYLDATGVRTMAELEGDWAWDSEPMTTRTVTTEKDFKRATCDQIRAHRHNARSAALKLQKLALAA